MRFTPCNAEAGALLRPPRPTLTGATQCQTPAAHCPLGFRQKVPGMERQRLCSDRRSMRPVGLQQSSSLSAARERMQKKKKKKKKKKKNAQGSAEGGA